MASNLLAMASNLLAMIAWPPTYGEGRYKLHVQLWMLHGQLHRG